MFFLVQYQMVISRSSLGKLILKFIFNQPISLMKKSWLMEAVKGGNSKSRRYQISCRYIHSLHFNQLCIIFQLSDSNLSKNKTLISAAYNSIFLRIHVQRQNSLDTTTEFSSGTQQVLHFEPGTASIQHYLTWLSLCRLLVDKGNSQYKQSSWTLAGHSNLAFVPHVRSKNSVAHISHFHEFMCEWENAFVRTFRDCSIIFSSKNLRSKSIVQFVNWKEQIHTQNSHGTTTLY